VRSRKKGKVLAIDTLGLAAVPSKVHHGILAATCRGERRIISDAISTAKRCGEPEADVPVWPSAPLKRIPKARSISRPRCLRDNGRGANLFPPRRHDDTASRPNSPCDRSDREASLHRSARPQGGARRRRDGPGPMPAAAACGRREPAAGIGDSPAQGPARLVEEQIVDRADRPIGCRDLIASELGASPQHGRHPFGSALPTEAGVVAVPQPRGIE
jgi:hypothetical protein